MKGRKKTNKNKSKAINKMAIRTYISIITLNVNGLNAPTKRQRLAEWIQKQDPYMCCLEETHFISKDTHKLREREVPLVMMSSLKLLLVLVPAHVILGLALACLVHRTGKKMSTAYRIILYIPTIMTTVSVATAWSYLYDTDFGVINYFLEKLGIDKIPWLNSSVWAFWAIVIFSIWKFVGTPFLYYYIGLQNIPTSLYEAAEIDGANRRQKFRYVTLPMLTPTIFMVVVLSMISYIQCFDEPYVLTQGGPGISTTTVSLYIYRNFQAQNISYASILSVFLFVIIMIVTIIQFKISDKWVNYDTE